MMKEKKESESYQEKLQQAENIIKDIANESIDLDTLVEKVDHGYTLLKEMQDRLEQTKVKIENMQKKHEESEEKASL